MKAAMLREVGKPLTIEDVSIDKPGPREVLIRTKACGVCHSDLHMIEGTYRYPLPTVLGHEAAGVVEAIGDEVHNCEVGDHVITCLNAFCGHCEYCISGHMSLCTDPDTKRAKGAPPRLSQNGEPINQFINLSAFAEQMLVHQNALVKVRKDMPLDRAALVGCGVTTGVGAVQNTARIQAGSTVCVIGCGGVGLSAINGAAIAGAGRVIAVDMVGSKLNLAKEFGATDTINAGEVENLPKYIKEITNGGVDYSFEAIGLKVAAEQCFKMLRPGGTATIIGMIPLGTNIELHGAEFLQERKIQGSMMGSNRFPIDMPRYVDFYMNGKLKLDEMISARIKLEDVNEAFAEMKTGAVARSVIMFD
ncbi:MAG: Zn-dependent alcohol dehydrogenase [Alphaproteobacteria bacterium]